MGAILAIFGSVFSAIWGILAKLPWQLYVAIGLVLLGGWIFHGGSCRDFMCKRPVKPPRPPHSETFDVVSVPTGASIEVKLRGRRTAIIALQGIQAPNDGEPFASDSRANLESVAGSTIRVEWKRGLLRSSDAQDSLRQQDEDGTAAAETPVEVVGQQDDKWEAWYAEHVKTCKQCSDESSGPAPLCVTAFTKMQEILREGKVEVPCPNCLKYGFTDCCLRCGGDGKVWREPSAIREATETPEAPEARPPDSGVVYGISGACLQVEQVEKGLARCLPDAPKAWRAAEADAKKNKRGLWSQ